MKATGNTRQSRKADNRTAVYILVFAIGALIMLYPTISNIWNDHVFSHTITNYENVVKRNKDRLKEELTLAEKYNNDLLPKRVPDAFSVRDGKTDDKYEKILNIGIDGMMGYIAIPVIEVEIPIYHYTSEETLKKGAGHLFGSSLPVGGEGTHSVLSAHRGLPSAKLFSDLNLVEIGDKFYIHVLGKTLSYEVDQTMVVEPDQTETLAIVEEKDLVTLVTCTPYGVNTQRLLVRGHRIPNGLESADTEIKRDNTRLMLTLICILSGIALAYYITRVLERKDSRKRKWKKKSPENF